MNIHNSITISGLVWQMLYFHADFILGNFVSSTEPTSFTHSTIQPTQTISTTNSIVSTKNILEPTQSTEKRCPRKLTVCWKYNPPYIDRNYSGIFPEFLAYMVSTCCQNSTSLEYQLEAKDEADLQACVKNESTDFVLPLSRVQSYQEVIQFIESPGMTLVLNKKAIEATAQLTVWKTLTEAWPLLVLTVLLAAIAGVLIWALVSTLNCFLILNTISFIINFSRQNYIGVYSWQNCKVSNLRLIKGLC